jgi:hypothetical protein
MLDAGPKALVSDLWLSTARDAATYDRDGCYALCRKKAKCQLNVTPDAFTSADFIDY